MPDNVGYTPGSGASIAADDIGGVLYQRIKPTFGADGAATDVSESAPLPVEAYGELVEAVEALRFAIADLTKGLGYALPNATGFPIIETRQAVAGNLNMAATQSGTWNINAITALTTLTNQTQIGGYNAADQVPALMQIREDGLRANIIVT